MVDLVARNWLHFTVESDVVDSMVAVLDYSYRIQSFPKSQGEFLFVFVSCSARHEIFETEPASWLVLRQHDGGLDRG